MRKQTIKATSLAVAMTVFSSVAAMGQQSDSKSTDWLKDLTSRIELHGYAQGGYSYDDATGKTNSTFNLKRTLFWAKGRITDRFSFMFMHDFSSVVQEYYLDYRITRGNGLSVRLGQFKHSYSLENPLSPTMLELIDVYSQAVLYLAGEGPDPLNGVNYGRDQGIMLYGDLFNNHIHYELAVMNGQGVNRKDGNSDKDVIARLEYKPVNGLRFVASAQKGRGHAVGTAAWNPGVQLGDDYRRDRISAGAELKSPHLNVRAEYLAGKDGDVTSRGAYVTTSIPIVKGLDLVASADYYNRNPEMDYYQTNLTGGIQYWFFKKCRLQMQYTRCLSHFSNDYNWLQAQVQVAF